MISATFDRYDIAEAYYLLEMDWNVGGWLRERRSCQRRRESVGVQLHRMGFKARDLSFERLTRNGRAIYLNATRVLGLRGRGSK